MANFPTAISTLAGVLNKRQLTPDDAKNIELKICSQSEAEDELRTRLYGNIDFTERLPYHGLHGEYLDFARYRINYKDAGTYIKDGKVERHPKYRSPKGDQRQFVYLPKVGGLDWENIVINENEPLMITEGEYKAITACKAGIPCVGLGGIWTFYHTAGYNMPPPLDQARWIGKQVLICYDADQESTQDAPLKPTVGQAAMALATKLYKLGAVPRLLYIARTTAFAEARKRDPKTKMGLDDFIMAHGDIDELFSTVHNPIECRELAELNSQYAQCRGLAGVGVMDTNLGKLYRVQDFKNVELHRIRKSVGPKGGVTKIYVAEEFLEQRDKPTVDRIVFEPAWKPGYDRERAIYNQWTGWAELGEMLEHEGKREVDRVWRKLIDKLFGEHADYFERWCAHLMQRPGEKTSIGVILVSVLNGVGKSLLGEILRGMVGDVHGKACQLERLKSNFNAILERCLLLQVDEANGLQDGLESKLNDLITSDTVTIERKGFDAVTVSNYMRIYMTSNSMRPIRMNRENRRWLVVNAGVVEAELEDWSRWCDGAAKILKSQDGLGALRERLLRLDISDWNPTARVVVTEYMDEMVESSRSWSNVKVDELVKYCTEDWDNKKPWLITAELASVEGGKTIADFKAQVRARGGQTLKHYYKYNGKKVSGVVIDLLGLFPRKRESAGTGNGTKWVLDMTGGLGDFDTDWVDAAARAVKAWNMVNTLVRGNDKY